MTTIRHAGLDDVGTRLAKLERESRRLKHIGFAILLGSVAVFITGQAPATPQQPATLKPDSATMTTANRVAALELKVSNLSKQTANLQREIAVLLTTRWVPSSGNGAEIDDIKDDVDRVKRDVDDLKDDMQSTKNDVESVKRDMPSDSDVHELKTDVDSLKDFRKAVCSLSWNTSAYLALHGGVFPPCPAF